MEHMCVDPCAVAVWILPPVTYFHNKSHTTALHIEHTHTHTSQQRNAEGEIFKSMHFFFAFHAIRSNVSNTIQCAMHLHGIKYAKECSSLEEFAINGQSPSENPIVYEWNRESPFDQWLCAKNRKEIINFDLNFYGENQSKQLQLIVNMKHWKDKH